ncbi:MAG TPA: thioredoxin family protein [Ferruginibacter sp.]|nr:thioredoxin family protein [Ferruginibacter sp.]
MKNIIIIFIIMLFALPLAAQEKKLYNPTANAAADIEMAVKKAAAEKKFVLLQGGGNWCKWCIEFARFAKADTQIDSLINSSFVWYHLNYSKENENLPLFAKYGYPQRFGFPVFIVLNEKGERIHLQDSALLEDGKSSYSKEKVLEFLNGWTPKALDPSQYEKK